MYITYTSSKKLNFKNIRFIIIFSFYYYFIIILLLNSSVYFVNYW